ncbi:MAG: diaminopimelate dehydrogenase [Eubacteriaceae bacterium]|nr:diaminopimelate dehydrogenase [Eubacteriaceae bacterium]
MIKIGIVGYGNLGRGVEYAVEQAADMELVAIFSRRPKSVEPRTNTAVVALDEFKQWEGKIDVMVLCGGSSNDLPVQGPMIAEYFNTVDSFDTHADIPQYFADMDGVLKTSQKLGVIAVGWDPGLFSMNRLLMSAVLPEGESYTFYGKGLSQGHSNAIRQLDGVLDAVQYTVPIEESMEKVRTGQMPELSNRDKHIRECYVVLEEGVDAAKVETDICTMPNYFADNITLVNFISMEELERDHRNAVGHQGFVIRSGKTGEGIEQLLEFSLKLASNSEFTASVMAAFARAIHIMANEGKSGALTAFDIPIGLLSPKSSEELRAELL